MCRQGLKFIIYNIYSYTVVMENGEGDGLWKFSFEETFFFSNYLPLTRLQ